MNFLEIGPAHVREIEISETNWMSFPEFANKGQNIPWHKSLQLFLAIRFE